MLPVKQDPLESGGPEVRREKISPATPQVSVIIPTYRHSQYVVRTIKSVLEQAFSDYEIIVVNDGSPDQTRKVLEPFVENRTIRYYEQPNRGQAAARNEGVRHAKGEFIAFLDDDDFWPPDKLLWQVRFLEHHPEVGIVGGTYLAVDEADLPVEPGDFHPSITFESLFARNPFLSPGQTLMRSALLADIGGLNPAIWGADDWDLWFRALKHSAVVMVDQLALYYRVHHANSSNQSARLLKACCDTIEIHLRDVPKAQRAKLRGISYSTIYRGFGSRVVNEAKAVMRKGRVIKSLGALRSLRPLSRGIYRNGPLCRILAWELLLKPMRTVFYPKQRTVVQKQRDG